MPDNETANEVHTLQQSVDELDRVINKFAAWFTKSANQQSTKKSKPAPPQTHEYIAGAGGSLIPVETVANGGGTPRLEPPKPPPSTTPNQSPNWGAKLLKSNLGVPSTGTVAGVTIPASNKAVAGGLAMYGALSSAGQQALPAQMALSNLSEQAGLMGQSGAAYRNQAVGFGNRDVNNAAPNAPDAAEGAGTIAASAGGFNPMFRQLMGSANLSAYTSGGSVPFSQAAQFAQNMYLPQTQAGQIGILGPGRSALNIGGGTNSASQVQQNVLDTVFNGQQDPAKLAHELRTGSMGQQDLASMGLGGAAGTAQLEGYNEVAAKSHMPPGQIQQLFNTAEHGSPSSSQSAQATLQKYGVNETDLQHMQNVNAIKSSRQNELYNPYTAGLADATGAIAKFNEALNDFMASRPGHVVATAQGAGAALQSANAGNLLGGLGGAAGAATGAAQGATQGAGTGGAQSQPPGTATAPQSPDPSELQTLSQADPAGVQAMEPQQQQEGPQLPDTYDSGQEGAGGSYQPGPLGGSKTEKSAQPAKQSPNPKGQKGNNGGGHSPASGQAIAAFAEKFKGRPYKWGGPESGKGGWDCSSFVSFVLHGVGIAIPGGWTPNVHGPVVSTYQNWSGASTVSRKNTQAGDLVIYVGEHIAIATSNKEQISDRDPALGLGMGAIQENLGSGIVIRRVKAAASGGSGSGPNGSSGTLSTTTTYGGLGLDAGTYGSSEEVDVITQGLSSEAGQNDFSGITSVTTGTPGSGGGGNKKGGGGGSIGNVGPGMKNLLSAILKGLGAPVNSTNIGTLSHWAEIDEGFRYPGGPNKGGKYNPLNTEEPMPGSTFYNHTGGGSGVQNYKSPSQGAQATVKTLENGRYSGIVKGFKSGKGLSGSGPWNSELSTWSGGGYSTIPSHAEGTVPMDAPKRPSKLTSDPPREVKVTSSNPIEIDLHGAQFDPDRAAVLLVEELRTRLAAA